MGRTSISRFLQTISRHSSPRQGSAKPLSQAKPVKGQRSILTDFDSQGVEGVTGGKFIWDANSVGGLGDLDLKYTFSLRNRLRENVKNVHYLVIFYDRLGDPIDITFEQYLGVIPAGLAKRITGTSSDFSVKKLSTRSGPPIGSFRWHRNKRNNRNLGKV